jgi:hypothetical protein
MIYCNRLDLLKKTYDVYIKQADLLKEYTKGRINLYHANVHDTVIYQWIQHSKNLEAAESIDQLESKFIEGCTSCGLTWCQKEVRNKQNIIVQESYEGIVHEYDINSAYSAYMSSESSFPIKRGEFQHITQSESLKDAFYRYGIYHCKIEPSNSDQDRLFRFSTSHYYTHISMNAAKSLNFKMTMVEDGEANVLRYSPDKCIRLSSAFKSYIDEMFKIKDEMTLVMNAFNKSSTEYQNADLLRDISKQLLNKLWGELSERRRLYDNIDEKDIDDVTILAMTPYIDSKTGIEKMIVENVKNQSMYKTNYVRIKPFITSNIRSKIASVMVGNLNTIVRVHTDGIYSSIERPDIVCSMNLGDYKHKTGYVKIKNIMSKIK